jgi:hypothetical protein
MMFLAIAGTLMTSCSTDDNPVGHPTIHGENDKVIDLKDLLKTYTGRDPIRYVSYTLQDGYTLTNSDYEIDRSKLYSYYCTIIIPDDATVTFKDFFVPSVLGYVHILCEGSATIIIVGGNNFSTHNYPAIEVGGEGTTLTIRGRGSLSVEGDHGFAAIGSAEGNSCGDINIESGYIDARKGYGAYCSIGRSSEDDKGGKVTVCRNVFRDGIIDDIFNASFDEGDNILFLSLLDSDVVLTEDVELRDNLRGDYKISIADGVSVSLDNVSIKAKDWAGITCEGNAIIILRGYNYISSSQKSGILVSGSDKTLTILGSGCLDVTGGENEAGIGANGNCGNINIECSGVINASCAGSGVGIGSVNGTCGYITIGNTESYEPMGTINAKSTETITIPGVDISTSNGVGIGSFNGSCGDITIISTVHATGGDIGVGIGSYGGSCGYIDIEGSGSASGGKTSGCCIGIFNMAMTYCGRITINGTLYWDGSNFRNDGEKYLRTSPLSW